MARPTSNYTPHLIIEANYNYYAIPMTPEITEALSVILSSKKVNHDTGQRFTESIDRSDLKIYVGEVENANN